MCLIESGILHGPVQQHLVFGALLHAERSRFHDNESTDSHMSVHWRSCPVATGYIHFGNYNLVVNLSYVSLRHLPT